MRKFFKRKLVLAAAAIAIPLVSLLGYLIWVQSDPLNSLPWWLKASILSEREALSKPLTPEQIQLSKQFPVSEQAYRLQEIHSGGTPRRAKELGNHCDHIRCPDFPAGYYSLQQEGIWYYFPLNWSRRTNPEIPGDQEWSPDGKIWTHPKFKYREGVDFEVTSPTGRITSRVSFAGDSAFETGYFLEAYEAKFLEQHQVVGATLRRNDAFMLRKLPRMPVGQTTPDEFPWSEEFVDYDKNFWLVDEGPDVDGYYQILLVSKLPIFQGRQAIIQCGGRCRISPLVARNTQGYLMATGGIFHEGRSAFIHEYGDMEVRGHISDLDQFRDELEKNGNYSFLPEGSDLLVEFVELLDRTIVRMRTADPTVVEEWSALK